MSALIVKTRCQIEQMNRLYRSPLDSMAKQGVKRDDSAYLSKIESQSQKIERQGLRPLEVAAPGRHKNLMCGKLDE